jgi:hypothetical protein
MHHPAGARGEAVQFKVDVDTIIVCIDDCTAGYAEGSAASRGSRELGVIQHVHM